MSVKVCQYAGPDIAKRAGNEAGSTDREFEAELLVTEPAGGGRHVLVTLGGKLGNALDGP